MKVQSKANTWIRGREDDGVLLPGTLQTADLHADHVAFEDGTVVSECPWSPTLPLDAYLYALGYEPLTAPPTPND